MGRKNQNPFRKCETGPQFIKAARKLGAEVERGKGSHVKVYPTDAPPDCPSFAVIPDHGSRPLATGTRCSIRKVLTLMFLGGVWIAALVLVAW